MWRMQYVCVLAVVLCLITGVQSAQAFSVTSEGQFDENAQQFYQILRKASGVSHGDMRRLP